MVANGLQGELLETTADELANVASINAVAASQTGATTTTLGLGTAFKGLGISIKNTTKTIWAFLTTNPIGQMVGVVSAITAVIATIVTINKKIEEHREKIKEAGETARDEIESLKSELDDLSSSADKAAESYSKLIDGVDSLNHTNISLSDEEYEEFISASNELAELFPELVIGLDKEGNKILDLGSNAEESIAKINDLIEAQQKLVAEETEEKLVDVYKGTYEDTRDISNELELYKKNLDYIRSVNFNEIMAGLQGYSGNKTISLSESYMNGLDSEILMNNMAKVINDSLGTELKPRLSDATNEWFLDLSTLTEEQYENAIHSLYLKSNLLKEKISESLEASISGARDDINKHHKQELSSIFTALSDDADYTSLTDTERQLADALISGLDYSKYRDEIEPNYNGDITRFLNKEILDLRYNASKEEKEEINSIYNELLSIDPDASLSDNIAVIEQYINDLAEILNIDSEKLKVMLGYELDEDKERINQAKIKATGSSTIEARSISSGYAQVQHAINQKENASISTTDCQDGKGNAGISTMGCQMERESAGISAIYVIWL
ncbi:MAG: coiled-coil domain-containing protein 22 [Bacteroides sp.]|nr:coiled-coil domain-containing protein 22 [Bacteroides sp.]MCM1549191.1 coiled-coil domain-containing protein 22 [Clostridium sp.]